MYLMRKLMDEVFYVSSPKAGNTLTMIKRKGVAG
jgi:anti-sigma regulatory factor (Ser/Thr protein kinase)